jgi:hypothetical protein
VARVVVSSHLDDAVCSAFGVLSPDTTVITVLAAIPPLGKVGGWDAEGGATDSHDRVIERREEDRRALTPTGARRLHLDFADGQYVSAGMLHKPRQSEVEAALKPAMDQVAEIYAPAGIGNDEHAFVRDAVLAVRPDATLYADLPYALKPERGGFNLPPDIDSAHRQARDVELGHDRTALKLESVTCYKTQLPQLRTYFGDFLNLSGLGRERFWRFQSKLGRNDPCWCNSGKKFKKCHGRG